MTEIKVYGDSLYLDELDEFFQRNEEFSDIRARVVKGQCHSNDVFSPCALITLNEDGLSQDKLFSFVCKLVEQELPCGENIAVHSPDLNINIVKKSGKKGEMLYFSDN